MKSILKKNDTPPQLTYPCLLLEKYDEKDVVVLAISKDRSMVVHSDHTEWSLGDDYGKHSDLTDIFDGSVTLLNHFSPGKRLGLG